MTITKSYGECYLGLSRDNPLIAGGFQTFSATTQLWHVASGSGTVPAMWVAPYPGFIYAISGFHYLPSGSSPTLQYQAYRSTAGSALTAIAGCITTATTPSSSASSITPFLPASNAYPFLANDALSLYVVPASAVTSSVLMQIFLTVSSVV